MSIPETAAKEAGRTTELSPSKRMQILRGARALFRELGYERASVDAIAARAGVSKATIYNHFREKKALFLAAFGSETAEVRERFLALLDTPGEDIEADLRRIGEQMLRLACAPASIDRLRVVVGEAGRFPELGRALHECTTVVGREKLARYLERAAERGLLEIHDPLDAAGDLWSLCIGDLFREVLLGVREAVPEAVVAARVERGVRTFLRAYRPRG